MSRYEKKDSLSSQEMDLRILPNDLLVLGESTISHRGYAKCVQGETGIPDHGFLFRLMWHKDLDLVNSRFTKGHRSSRNGFNLTLVPKMYHGLRPTLLGL